MIARREYECAMGEAERAQQRMRADEPMARKHIQAHGTTDVDLLSGEAWSVHLDSAGLFAIPRSTRNESNR
jgi:hypothetical protein